LIKATYKVSKKEFFEGVTLEYMKDLMYVPELRVTWDEGFKEFKKIEGNEEIYIVKAWFKSPMFIISERDVVDKRIEFFKDNVYYNFSSSVDDKVTIINEIIFLNFKFNDYFLHLFSIYQNIEELFDVKII